MATAKKLPSGSWRCLAYSHTETVWNEKQGKWIEKRIYESFTSDDPSPRGRKEAELAAAEFQLNNRARKKAESSQSNTNLTLREAIEKYINTSDGVLSPSTCIFRKNCASVPEERSAIPLQTEQSSAG